MLRPVLTASLALIVLAGCGEKPVMPTPPPPAVEVITVATEALPVPGEFVGKTVATGDVQIRARVTGTILEKPFAEGTLVKVGDVLYRIDPREFQANLDVAKARMAQAKAGVEKADREVKRFEPLVEQKIATQFDLDSRRTDLLQATADFALQEATARNAELNLSYCVISAPSAGKIGKSVGSVGGLIGPSDGVLATIDGVDPLNVEFTVSEREIIATRRQITEGVLSAPKLTELEVRAKLVTGAAYPLPGRIDFADVRIRPETGTALLRAVFPNPDGKLVPGQFIRVELIGLVRNAAILVPQTAVMQSPAGASVYLVDAEGKAESRAVVLGQWYGDRWLIESGLKVGDRVVTEGMQKVRPGAPVTILTAAAAPAVPVAAPAAPAQAK